MIILFDKKYTETLSGMLKRFRIEYPEYRESKVTYAGRLDPMASGVVLLLTNDDVHRKEDFLLKDKTYTVSFVLGMTTDTFDILGIPKISKQGQKISEEDITKAIQDVQQLTSMEYPVFSSKTINGKPLWRHAREGEPTKLPTRKVSIHSAQLLCIEEISPNELLEKCVTSIGSIIGDFRQQEIIIAWNDVLKNYENDLIVVRAQFRVSTGTYIRSLVHTIGENLGLGATSVHIHRTHIHIDN